MENKIYKMITEDKFIDIVKKATNKEIGKDFGFIIGTHAPYEMKGLMSASNKEGFIIWKKDDINIPREFSSRNIRKYHVHKSWRHHDGELCFGGGWFIVVAVLPTGQISNHYEAKYWDLFKIPETEKALFSFDGHTSTDVLERLKSLQNDNKKYNTRTLLFNNEN